MYKLKSDGIEDDGREKKHDKAEGEEEGVARGAIVSSTRIHIQ